MTNPLWAVGQDVAHQRRELGGRVVQDVDGERVPGPQRPCSSTRPSADTTA